MKRFSAKRVFITGAGSGLGRAMALEFASLGWKVGAGDINEKAMNETCAMITSAGGTPLGIKCDVSKQKDFTRSSLVLQKEWNGIDILVNNAGIAAGGIFEKISDEQWDRIISINLKSVIYSCRTFIPLMKKQGSGHILNIASNAGITCLPEMSSYNITKAGVIALSETLRGELFPHNIGVTVACPTFIKTNLLDSFSSTDASQKKMAEWLMKNSQITAEEFARYTIKSVEENKLYTIAQSDGRKLWYMKRFRPEWFFNSISEKYRNGLEKQARKAKERTESTSSK